PLVACHKNKQQKAKLRYKEMLASTIQFSKYGQEHQLHNHHLKTNPASEGNNPPHPQTVNSLMEAGPSHHTQPTSVEP
ncbi:hypothetical protein, partial [Kribbella pittospori]|uniref:hypothetical protein n=1 Tax=Kribbella pittospori TaxID=722689 RepID=UPI001EDD0DDE